MACTEDNGDVAENVKIPTSYFNLSGSKPLCSRATTIADSKIWCRVKNKRCRLGCSWTLKNFKERFLDSATSNYDFTRNYMYSLKEFNVLLWAEGDSYRECDDPCWVHPASTEAGDPISSLSFFIARRQISSSKVEYVVTVHVPDLDLCDSVAWYSLSLESKRGKIRKVFPSSKSIHSNSVNLIVGDEDILPGDAVAIRFTVEMFCESWEILDISRSKERLFDTVQLSRDMLCLLESGDFSDFTLHAEGRDFPVHRGIVFMRCPGFEKKYEEMKEKNGRLCVTDVDVQSLQLMLRYMYGDFTEWNKISPAKAAMRLYYAAEKYKLKNWEVLCAATLSSMPWKALKEIFGGSVNASADSRNVKVNNKYVIQKMSETRDRARFCNVDCFRKKETLQFTWTIENFSLYKSTDFSFRTCIPRNNEKLSNEYKIKLRIGTGFNGHISLKIRPSRIKSFLQDQYQVSIIDAKGNLQNTVSRCSDFKVQVEMNLIKTDVLFRSKQLLPNDTLTLNIVISTCFQKSVCLKGNHVGDMFASDMKRLFESQFVGDIAINCDDESIKANKAILAVRSSVFAAMLRHNFTESTTNIINIEDVDFSSLKQMLHYIYSGKLNESIASDPGQLLWLAEKYNLQKLKQMSLAILSSNISLENVLDFLVLSHMHSSDILKEKAMTFFKFHEDVVVATQSWKKFLLNHEKLAHEALQYSEIKTTVQSRNVMPVERRMIHNPLKSTSIRLKDIKCGTLTI